MSRRKIIEKIVTEKITVIQGMGRDYQRRDKSFTGRLLETGPKVCFVLRSQWYASYTIFL